MRAYRWLWLLVFGWSMWTLPAQVYRLPQGSKHLFVYNNNFFYDREYSNLIADGYTLAGHRILAGMQFKIDSLWMLQAGVDLTKFWGARTPIPTRFHWAVVFHRGNHRLIIGDLDNRRAHRMYRPLYDEASPLLPGRHETGLQYLYASEKHRVETWLDWHRFIFPRDTFRERLNFGINASLLLRQQGTWEVRLPLQILLHHRGGQINLKGPYLAGKNNIMSVLSGASGLDITYRNNPHTSYRLQLLAFGTTMNTDNPEELGFRKGSAFRIQCDAYMSRWNAGLGYWYARRFSAPLGEAIFQTASRRVDKYMENGEVMDIFKNHREPRRILWDTHLIYHGRINQRLTWQAKAEMFFQPYRSAIEEYEFIYDVVNHTDFLLAASLRYSL